MFGNSVAAAATEKPPADLGLNTDYLFLKVDCLITRHLHIQIRGSWELRCCLSRLPFKIIIHSLLTKIVFGFEAEDSH